MMFHGSPNLNLQFAFIDFYNLVLCDAALDMAFKFNYEAGKK